MNALVEVPDDIAEKLAAKWQDFPLRALLVLAEEARREGVLTRSEVDRLRSQVSKAQEVGSVEEPSLARLTPAQERAFARMEKGLNFGGAPYPRRDDLYDREVLRHS